MCVQNFIIFAEFIHYFYLLFQEALRTERTTDTQTLENELERKVKIRPCLLSVCFGFYLSSNARFFIRKRLQENKAKIIRKAYENCKAQFPMLLLARVRYYIIITFRMSKPWPNVKKISTNILP